MEFCVYPGTVLVTRTPGTPFSIVATISEWS